ncbi:MAG: ATP-binding protein [Candidatus Woesearchaeota archaeon]
MKITFYDPDEEVSRTKKGKNSSFTLNWADELGWKENPFTLQNTIAAMAEEEQEINLFFIKQRRLATITAPTGRGKTTLLRWLQEELSNRNGFFVAYLQEHQATTPEQLREELADAFRGLFRKGREISTQELLLLIQKKVRKQQLVLLLDDTDHYEEEHFSVLEALLTLPNTQILLTSTNKHKTLPAQNDLELEVEKRTPEQYTQILRQRIELVGGAGTHPFTEEVIKKMSKETSNTQEFLQLAMETAIHIALNKVTQGEETITKTPKSKNKTSSSGVKGRERTKYDELIESLGEELTK